MTPLLVSEELFSTAPGAGSTLFEALLEAAHARGFVSVAADVAASSANVARMIAMSPEPALPGPKVGARVRATLGAHAQPIAGAAARKLGASVTLLVVSGTASTAAGRLVMALTARAVRVAASGKASPLALDAQGLAHQDGEAPKRWTAAELERAAHDHARNVLGAAADRLGLSLAYHTSERVEVTLRRPTGTPRVEEVASLIAIGTGYEIVAQPDGRVLVRITLADAKRVAFLSAAEAVELRAQLARGGGSSG